MKLIHTHTHTPLIDNIINRGQKVDTIIVITACARATTHTPSMEIIESTFKIPNFMKITFYNNNKYNTLDERNLI